MDMDNKLIAALFTDSKAAGEAVSALKDADFTDSISVLARDEDGELSSHQVEEDITEGAAVGAATGGVAGAIIGAVGALTPVTIAGIGAVVIGGPLAVLIGATTGALGGGLVGALVDAGIPDKEAEMFEEQLLAGEVLVTVEGSEDDVEDVRNIFNEYGAHSTTVINM